MPAPSNDASAADCRSAILATAVVPWTVRGEFDADAFVRQVRHLAGALTRHI